MSLRRTRPLEDALRVVRSRATQGLGVARRRRPATTGLDERERRRIGAQIDACLEPRLSDVIARARVEDVAASYGRLDEEGRAGFFGLVAQRAGVDAEQVNLAVASFEAVAHRHTGAAEASTAELAQAGAALRAALHPGWERLFRLLCSLDGGIKFAVDLRADLLEVLAAARHAAPGEAIADPALLACLDDDLKAVLRGYVDLGVLELRRITWETSASFLEKLIRYEAVHAITSWADLKNRLRGDRRCYAFVHPGLPGEPLIFVEVALVDGLSDRIGPLLDLESPLGDVRTADTAIFYSISACQAGLSGISLGDFLIKRVVEDLRRDLPGVRRFATLSPVPGLRSWLAEQLATAPGELLGLLDGDQRRLLVAHAPVVPDGPAAPLGPEAEPGLPTDGAAAPSDGAGDAAAALGAIVADETWPADPGTVEPLRPVIVRLAAHYLTKVQRDGHAADPVAHFHLSNGARVERLNWAANRSPLGVRESLGVMVNYAYDPDRIEANHMDYRRRGRVVASSGVSRLAG